MNDKWNMFVLCLCVHMCPCLYVHSQRVFVCVHVCDERVMSVCCVCVVSVYVYVFVSVCMCVCI